MAAPNRLAGDLWAVFNGDDPNVRYSKFLKRSEGAFRRLVESLILHPTTIVPTDDYLSLAILADVFGVEAVASLLDSGRVRVVRLRGSIGYIGGGRGIDYFEILDENKNPRPHAAPVDESVDNIVAALGSRVRDAKAFAALVKSATTEVEVSELTTSIRNATYQDIHNSAELAEIVAEAQGDLNQLRSVAANQVRMYGGLDAPWTGDSGDIVMAIATAHIEARVADIVGAADISTTTPIGQVLRAEWGVQCSDSAIPQFAELVEIAAVPDVGEAVLSRRASVRDILRLVESKDGEQFQEWFHEHCRTDTLTTAREYTALLREVAPIQSVSVKVIRFVITSLLGKLPVLGEIAGGIDAFFLERWLRGNSPKYFIEDLAQLLRKR